MTTPTADHLAIDPERYGEAESFFEFEQSRREFFGIAGAGVIVALLMADECAAQLQPGRLQPGGAAPRQIGAWIHIGEKSEITVYTGKVEIGQNIRTSLSQVVAEELHVALGSIRVVMADTAAVPFDMGTFGSRTTPTMAPQLRRAAAAARAVLIELAAEKSKLKPVSFTVADGKVSGPQGQPTYTFGELTRGQKLMKVIAAGVPTASANKWTVAGTSVPKVDGRAFVTGSHRYASDTHRPGMLFGKVLRPPAFQTQLASVNAKAAEKKAGLTVVRDGDFVGIVGPTESAAAEGLTLIEATWKATPKQVGSQDLFKHLKETAGLGGGGGRLGEAAERKVRSMRGSRPPTRRSRQLTRLPTSLTCHWNLVRRSRSGRTAKSRSGRVLSVLLGCAAKLRPRSASPPIESASSFRTWARVMVESTAAKRPWKRPGSPSPPASRSRSSGRAKRSSHGPTFARPV